MVDILLLLVGLVVILAGAELFTNGVEWFGHKLNVAEGAVGSVLAAVGTALPETMIPVIAILFPSQGTSTATAEGVGVGAILGAPFTLATLAMFVTGVTVLVQGRRRATGDTMLVDSAVVTKDIRYFFVAYALAVLAAFLPAGADLARIAVAVVLLAIYAWYVRGHFQADSDVDAADLVPLRLHRLDVRAHRREPSTPRLRIINLQVLAGVGLILGGAVLFVDSVEHLSKSLGVPAIVLALVIAPIATELPENFNGILWVRRAKDTLALGNITGAMIFQSCVPTVVGLVFAADAWKIDTNSRDSLLAFASAGIAFVAMAVIFMPVIRGRRLTGRSLLLGGGFYAAYLLLVGAFLVGLV
jgi:cation:H+ antiporter